MAHSKKKKIVCIGTGTGQAALLRGLKDYPCKLVAIVSVTDNGGHSGELRKELGIPQVGDGRNCLIALSPSNSPITKLFDFRLSSGKSIGNFILTGLVKTTGSLDKAFKIASKVLKTKGEVYPVTNVNTHIAAELEDGRIIKGEWQIIERNPRTEIKRLFLEPGASAHFLCLKAIKEADFIIIGPGSLRTGIIANLLVERISPAINKSSGKVIYVSNLMTQPGQSDNFTTVSAHLKELELYLERKPDFIIANNGKIHEKIISHYQKIGSLPVSLDRENLKGVKVIVADLVPDRSFDQLAQEERIGGYKKWTHILVHDSKKLAQIIWNLLDS